MILFFSLSVKFQKMKKFLKKMYLHGNFVILKSMYVISMWTTDFFFPKGVSLITWYVSVWPCSRPGIFLLLLLAAFYSLLSDDPLHFPCPGWNTWFHDCISNMLLLRSEFDTDPSPTLSPFSCAVTRNLVTSENLEFMLQ